MLASMAKMVNPSSVARNSTMRCLSWKNSCVPRVASPSATMRASPITRFSGCMSARSWPASAVSSRMALEAIHSTTDLSSQIPAQGRAANSNSSAITMRGMSTLLRRTLEHDLAVDDSRYRFDILDLIHRAVEKIFRDHHHVGQLSLLDRSLDFLLEGKISAAQRPHPQRFHPRHPLLGVQRRAVGRLARDGHPHPEKRIVGIDGLARIEAQHVIRSARHYQAGVEH